MARSEHQETIDRLFEQAVQLDIESRNHFLDIECAELPASVREEVEALIAVDGAHRKDTRTFFQAAQLNLADMLSSSVPPDELIGKKIGSFEIKKTIASGGFGKVYLGIREDEFRQKVAIKLVRSDYGDNVSFLKRFEIERQVLADLNHPYIAALIDGGRIEDGRPYFAMEYVDGRPITEYCHVQMSVADRLKLFQKVCQAVTHAHQFNVVHRDIKPNNILVTDDGIPKLLDFGIAKLTDPRTRQRTIALTETGQSPMTLGYASPEQLLGKPIGASTDIYSLGVVLYEILTGRHPFPVESALRHDYVRIVCQQDPSKPSSVISETVSSVPNPNQLRRELSGDIDNVVLKALRKEPERRYQSVHDLSEDIQRFFDGRPVIAGKDSVVYKARKLVSRNRIAVVSLAAIVTMLVITATVIWTTWQRNDKATDSRVWSQRGRLIDFKNETRVSMAEGLENNPSWSPDGKRLVFEANPRGNGFFGVWDLYVSQIGTGFPQRLTAGRFPSWSPLDDQIAFLQNHEDGWWLSTIPVVGGSPRRILPLPDVGSFPQGKPFWTHDGKGIYVRLTDSEQGATIVALVDISTRTVLEEFSLSLPSSNSLLEISPSPDDRFMACVEGIFNSVDPEVSKIWLFPTDGSEPIPVTDGKHKDRSPAWSPTTGNLLFLSNRGGTMDQWELEISESGQPERLRQITSGRNIRSIVLSDNGRKIAYSLGRTTSSIWRVPIQSDAPTAWADAEKVFSKPNTFVQYVDVTSDGSHLVFSADLLGNLDVWTLSLKDPNAVPIPLTSAPSPEDAPRWSPDGKQIAYRAFAHDNQEVFVMTATGGNIRQITKHPAEDSVPSWFPDGKSLVFTSRRDGSRDIWRISLENGSIPEKIVGPLDSEEYFPLISRSGEWLLYQSNQDGSTKIYRFDLANGVQEKLGNHSGQMPVWDLRGAKVFYTHTDGEIWGHSVQDKTDFPVTNLGQSRNGRIGWGKAIDKDYIYFTWWEDDADVYVADIVVSD